MSKSGSRGRSSGGNGKVKKMAIVPEETVAKLNTVLSGLIARPQPPSQPDIIRLDELQRDLDHAKQLEDPVARMAAVSQGYENWRREYDKFLGRAPTGSFIPPVKVTPTPLATPVSSRPASPTPSKEKKEDKKTTDTGSSAGSSKEEGKPFKLDLRIACPECSRIFGSKGALTRHAHAKHGIWLGKAGGLRSRRTRPVFDGAKKTKGLVFYPASTKR